MKFLFSLVLLMFSSVLTIAQDSNQLNWFTNLEESLDWAKQNDSKVLMVFGGSDWCRPCIKLKKNVLENDIFIEKVGNKIAILYLDFPVRKKNRLTITERKYNESLAAKYNPKGLFPKIILLDANQEIIQSPVFEDQSPESFYKLLANDI